MMVKDNSCGIAELQDKMLDILKYFINICEKNDLRYWLAYGSCLGAVRHNGFIPWDDDLDVQMPRPDYEKLWKIWNATETNEKYKLCRSNLKNNYHHRVMQIVNLTTTFINKRCVNEDIEHGVYIDIIPMDGFPKKKAQQMVIAQNAILYSVYNIQNKPEFNGGKLTGVMSVGTSFLLSVVKDKDKRYKIWRRNEQMMTQYNYDECEYVVSLECFFKELFSPYPVKWFETKKVPFEDIEVNIPREYGKYLTRIYGDCMQLPPKEKQIVKHNTVFIDLNHSYKQYKGQYYCVNSQSKGDLSC